MSPPHTHHTRRFAFPALKLPLQLHHSTPLADAVDTDAAASIADACAPMLHQASSHAPVALVRVASTAALLPLTDLMQHVDALCPPDPAAPIAEGDVMVVVADAQYDPAHPSWPLRNVLAMLAAHVGGGTLRVLCLRGDMRSVHIARCTVLTVHVPTMPGTF